MSVKVRWKNLCRVLLTRFPRHIFSSSLMGCKSIVWLPPSARKRLYEKNVLYKSTTQSPRTGLPPREEWRCGIRNLTFKEMNGRFLVRTHELAAEKFVSKLLCLHKSAIFCHAYFVRGEFNPFYKKEKWKVCRARNSLNCSITMTQFQPLLGITVRNIYQTLVS